MKRRTPEMIGKHETGVTPGGFKTGPMKRRKPTNDEIHQQARDAAFRIAGDSYTYHDYNAMRSHRPPL